MKSWHARILLVFFSATLLNSCAKRGTPDGGAVDLDPPKYVKAKPENFTTNFNSREIRIYFDEYVKVNDPQRQVIISPPMDPRPEITPLGTASKSVRIRINDTLKPQTTYTINFGRSIVDNNEGNPLNFFTYAFSTGPYIDSLTVSGNVSDALLKVPDNFVSIMLYEVDSTYNDSVVYNELPRYITNTLDSATTFQLKNLKEGTYQMVGLKDANNNYKFDPKTDKIAFADEYITVPTESVFDLILFREVLDDKFNRPQQKSGQHLIFGYEGVIYPDSLDFKMISPVPEDFTFRITRDAKKDTVHYWYKPALAQDSLKFVVSTPRFTDTLLTRVKEMEKDSLSFSFDPASSLGFDQDVKVIPSIPLDSVNESLISILNKDTLAVDFSGRYDQWDNTYSISFPKEEKQTYSFTALPGAFVGFFGKQNDTIRTKFRTQSFSDFGNLTINLQNVRSYPILVQLTSQKGEIVAEKYSTESATINFRNVKPGEYFLRLIYDRNGNRKWDSGKFLKGQQPEKVVYYPDLMTVRANWDDVYPFILE